MGGEGFFPATLKSSSDVIRSGLKIFPSELQL